MAKFFIFGFNPHDIRINQQENFRQLEEVFKYYQFLQKIRNDEQKYDRNKAIFGKWNRRLK